MGRFTPTERPLSGLGALGEAADSVADERDRRREQVVRDRLLAREEARATADDMERGIEYHEAEPTVTEEIQTPEIFRGARPGMAEGTQGSPLSQSLAQVRRPQVPQQAGGASFASLRAPAQRSPLAASLEGMERPRPPKIIALPGSFIRGQGFTETMVTDQDMAMQPGGHLRQPETRTSPDQRMRRLSGDEGAGGYFLNEENTPEARRQRGSEGLEVLYDMSPEEKRAFRSAPPEMQDEILRAVMDRREVDTSHDWITVDGADFPNTPEGLQRAEEWRTRHAAAGRAPEKPDVPDEVNWTYDSTRGVQINPRTGEVRTPSGLPARPDEGGDDGGLKPTESDRRAAAVVGRARLGFREITSLTEKFEGAPGIASAMSGLGGRYFQSADIQRFRSASRAVATAILRWESGANISESEIQEQAEAMIPVGGDKPETVEFKLDVLKEGLEALERSAALVEGRQGYDPNAQAPGRARMGGHGFVPSGDADADAQRLLGGH